MKEMANEKEQGELIRCPVCETYLKKNEGFTCPRCRKGPLCKKHRFPGGRECTSCVFEAKRREVSDLRNQEQGISEFMKLLQFVFLIFAVFFVAVKFGLADSVDFLKDSIVVEYLPYFGVLPAAGYLLFFIILYNQKSRIKELEEQMHDIEFKRMVK